MKPSLLPARELLDAWFERDLVDIDWQGIADFMREHGWSWAERGTPPGQTVYYSPTAEQLESFARELWDSLMADGENAGEHSSGGLTVGLDRDEGAVVDAYITFNAGSVFRHSWRRKV